MNAMLSLMCSKYVIAIENSVCYTSLENHLIDLSFDVSVYNLSKRGAV